MARRVKIGEAKNRLSALLARVEDGADLIICRGSVPIARVTRIVGERYQNVREILRRERAKQNPVTTNEILAWRHEGHSH